MGFGIFLERHGSSNVWFAALTFLLLRSLHLRSRVLSLPTGLLLDSYHRHLNCASPSRRLSPRALPAVHSYNTKHTPPSTNTAFDENQQDSSMMTLKYSFQDPVGEIRIIEDWSGEGNAIAGLQWPGGVVLRYVC